MTRQLVDDRVRCGCGYYAYRGPGLKWHVCGTGTRALQNYGTAALITARLKGAVCIKRQTPQFRAEFRRELWLRVYLVAGRWRRLLKEVSGV